MSNIIFVCHGSICRSPAAEYICKHLSNEHHVISRAVSYEEIGNDIYPPMKRTLLNRGIKIDRHQATHLEKEDVEWADYIFYMDDSNLRLLTRLLGSNDKIYPIYKWTSLIPYIEDPWYTGRYDKVVDDITTCIKAILENI
jgi:protein-tyrosine phosphatase